MSGALVGRRGVAAACALLAALAASAPEAAPMPDVAVLFAEVLERQNQIEEVREACT